MLYAGLWKRGKRLCKLPSGSGHGALLLCHTSNPGAPWLQEHPLGGTGLAAVAERAAARSQGDLGLFVGGDLFGHSLPRCDPWPYLATCATLVAWSAERGAGAA